MASILQDPMTFYAIAFIIFVALAYKFGRKAIFGWLDDEINKIRDELEQAKKLREEAEAVLVTYKKKQAEATADAENIIKQARADADRLKAEAAAELKTSMARHEQQAVERIRIIENEAGDSVRVAAIEAAVAMARGALATQMDAQSAATYTDHAIAEILTLAVVKSKAA